MWICIYVYSVSVYGDCWFSLQKPAMFGYGVGQMWERGTEFRFAMWVVGHN